ncbi:MAG: EVE domain-containing protein [Xanthobacteraceae bacterium]|nr:EVE domain-containing protein [Xanthobacteraceae bacterium]
MSYWLMKTEPDEYSWDDMVKKGAKGDAWTGVRNFIARNHMKAQKKGDLVFIYHTGKEKQIVGVAEVVKEHYKDPTDKAGSFYATDLSARYPLKTPVTLAAIKADARFKNMALVKYSRLSVQPVTATEWAQICKLGGVKG